MPPFETADANVTGTSVNRPVVLPEPVPTADSKAEV